MEKLPKRVSTFINSQDLSENNNINYVEFLDVCWNKPVMRTFAYQKTKTYGLHIQEVVREFLDHNEVNDSLYFGNLCGYKVVWEGVKKRSYSYYYNSRSTTYKFYKAYDYWRPNIFAERIQTNSEIVEIMKKFVPYFHISENGFVANIMEYTRTYISNSRLELLSKFGLDYLYNDKMMMKCNSKKMKIIVSWLKQNKAYAIKYCPSYQFINMALKNGENGEQTKFRCGVINDIKYMKRYGLEYSYEQMSELKKYLEKQGEDVTTYADYLQMSKKLNRDLNEHSVLFPRFLKLQHDELTKVIDAEANKEINSKLLTKYEMFSKFVCNIGALKIVVPKETSQFVSWGKTLHNCVGSCGYNKKMADGNCIIIGVFNGDEIVECCELNSKYEIIQLRGDHNQPSEHHQKAEVLVNMFIKNAQLQANC